MAISKNSITEAIKTAQELSTSANPSLRANAFEVILAYLLKEQNLVSSVWIKKPQPLKKTNDASEQKQIMTGIDLNRLASQLGITAEQVDDLYEIKDDNLLLRVKPSGKSIPEQRRTLAEILLVGYKFGVDTKSVMQSKILKAADEWNIGGTHFSRDIQKSKYLYSKAGGKGLDPVLSLAPSDIEEISTTVKILLNI